jgi:hypothetical protein
MSISEEEYPNNFLGVNNVQSVNAGASNKITAPLKLDTGALINNAGATANGALGAMIQSGAGVPVVGSPAGGFYFRTDGNSATKTNIYVCTVAGVAGGATWVGIA